MTGESKDPEAALQPLRDFLAAGLQERYFDTKAAAALALGKAGAAETAASLRPLLRSTHDTVRESALLALGMLRDEKSAPFMKGLLENRRQSEGVRVHAAVALGLVGTKEAGETLLAALQSPEGGKSGATAEIRAAAAMALGLTAHEPALGPLVAVLQSEKEDARLRAVAATALGRFGSASLVVEGCEVTPVETLLSALKPNQPPDVRRAALLALSGVWYDRMGASIMSLYDSDSDPWVKNLSLLVCAEKIGDEALKKRFQERVRRLLAASSGGESVASVAALAAGLSGDEEAVPELRRIFERAPTEETRAAAAVGLGFLGDEASVPLVLEKMAASRSDFFRSFCCVSFALRGKGDARVSQALRAILVDPASTGRLRSAAGLALAKMGDRQALSLLLGFLDKGDRAFRQLMVLSVGRFRDAAAFLPLKDAYEGCGNDFETQALVLVAVGNMVEKEFPPVLKRAYLHHNHLVEFPVLRRIFQLM